MNEIAPLSLAQLAMWEAIGADWPRYDDLTQPVAVNRCGRCDQGIYRVTDEHGTRYQYSPKEIRAQVVAHLRQAHPEMDPDRG